MVFGKRCKENNFKKDKSDDISSFKRRDDKQLIYYFSNSGNEEEFYEFFDHISNDIINIEDNCAIIYDTEFKDDVEVDFFINHNIKMIVFLVDNEVIDEKKIKIVLFSKEKNIKVVVLTTSRSYMENCSNNDFSKIQYIYLESLENDKQYLSSLENILKSVFVDSNTLEKIRSAFKGKIFLSYRQKDREKSKEIINEIHKNEEFRKLSIWYDKYIDTGEFFDDFIENELDKCNCFVLAITKSILEKNNIGENNYVIKYEYPSAVSKNKKILPIMLEKINIKELDKLLYPNKMENVSNIDDTEEISQKICNIFEDVLKGKLSISDNCYLGIAYMDGIETEQNEEYGCNFLVFASNKGNEMAINRLLDYYESKKEYSKAIDLLSKYLYGKLNDSNWNLIDYICNSFHGGEFQCSFDFDEKHARLLKLYYFDSKENFAGLLNLYSRKHFLDNEDAINLLLNSLGDLLETSDGDDLFMNYQVFDAINDIVRWRKLIDKSAVIEYLTKEIKRIVYLIGMNNFILTRRTIEIYEHLKDHLMDRLIGTEVSKLEPPHGIYEEIDYNNIKFVSNGEYYSIISTPTENHLTREFIDAVYASYCLAYSGLYNFIDEDNTLYNNGSTLYYAQISFFEYCLYFNKRLVEVDDSFKNNYILLLNYCNLLYSYAYIMMFFKSEEDKNIIRTNIRYYRDCLHNQYSLLKGTIERDKVKDKVKIGILKDFYEKVYTTIDAYFFEKFDVQSENPSIKIWGLISYNKWNELYNYLNDIIDDSNKIELIRKQRLFEIESIKKAKEILEWFFDTDEKNKESTLEIALRDYFECFPFGNTIQKLLIELTYQ